MEVAAVMEVAAGWALPALQGRMVDLLAA